MANFKEIKDEVTRLELAKRLYGEGIEWYGGDVSDKTLEDYPQELADNVFEDTIINWMGNGELEYEAGDSSTARKTRNDASANYSTGYFDIPIPIEAGTRIETSVYIPNFYREYWSVTRDVDYGWPSTVDRIGENTYAAYGYRIAVYQSTSFTDTWRTTVPIKTDGIFSQAQMQYYSKYILENSAIWKDSLIAHQCPLSFPFATLYVEHGVAAYTRPDSYWVRGDGIGLGLSDNFYWYGSEQASNYGYPDEALPSYPEYATAACFGDATNVFNQYTDISITFKTKDSSVYMDMFVDHDGGFSQYFPAIQSNVSMSVRHAFKPLGNFTFGTYNMRIFGSIPNSTGSWKGFRFKEFKVFDSNNNLIMNLVPRVHFVARVLRFQPCWYDTIGDHYYLSTSDYRDLNYGW